MEDRIEILRRKYEGFKRGEEDALGVMDEARSVLEEVKNKENLKIADEIEELLLDLEFSLEENKCKCHRKHTNH